MNLKSIIETILFVHGEPISVHALAKFAAASEEEVRAALHALQSEPERGIVVLEKDGEYQLGSRPENAQYVQTLMKSEFSEELSRAALETITIIAYKGPLTRVQIEFIRGVNSSFTLRNLAMRGLVERVENPKDARAPMYRVSFDFLKHFGLTKIEELPEFETLHNEKIEILEENTNAA